ncbi:hypothetical protein [Amycolatopsis sp. CA-230715]|nr:hypothetical protein [Amycolatopsis sp. CA-230715]QWF85352.1 hypothetical protein HUW46_08806 [Amycolatopsis sp. CA-230715]
MTSPAELSIVDVSVLFGGEPAPEADGCLACRACALWRLAGERDEEWE